MKKKTNKKWIQINLFRKQQQTHRQKANKYSYQNGSGEKDKLGVGIKIYILMYIKQITNNDLLYRTGIIINYLVTSHNDRQCKK